VTTKLAQLIAQQEGFAIPGSLPQRQNNPGDLVHAPGETHAPGEPDGIGSFHSVQAGWDMLERQLALYAERGLTLQQMVNVYAPPPENDTQAYLNFLCQGLACSPDTLVSQALEIS
jgi:hypothetical protein